MHREVCWWGRGGGIWLVWRFVISLIVPFLLLTLSCVCLRKELTWMKERKSIALIIRANKMSESFTHQKLLKKDQRRRWWWRRMWVVGWRVWWWWMVVGCVSYTTFPHTSLSPPFHPYSYVNKLVVICNNYLLNSKIKFSLLFTKKWKLNTKYNCFSVKYIWLGEIIDKSI